MQSHCSNIEWTFPMQHESMVISYIAPICTYPFMAPAEN